MSPRKSKPNSAWLIAWVLTVALHAGLVLGFRDLPSIRPAPTTYRPEPVQLVFRESDSKARRSDAPSSFSELPPDRADAAPTKPEFLSNVTSRARDLVAGGTTALPRMDGTVDEPMVRLEPGTPSRPSSTSPPATRPTEPPVTRTVETAQPGDTKDRVPAGTGGTRALSPRPPEAGARAPNDVGTPGSPGNDDIQQPEMANPDGNAALTGDVSLNTTAWNYAPWLMRYKRQLLSQWIAPAAYYLGILKEGGWAVIEVEISRSGKVLRLELLEQQGHPSLILAAQNAVRSVAPIEPLPVDFPEPTLILRIRMIYPKIRPR